MCDFQAEKCRISCQKLMAIVFSVIVDTMINLKNISLQKNISSPAAAGPYELRLDWDNDRHHAIILRSLSPDNIKQAFLDAAHLIMHDQHDEYL